MIQLDGSMTHEEDYIQLYGTGGIRQSGGIFRGYRKAQVYGVLLRKAQAIEFPCKALTQIVDYKDDIDIVEFFVLPGYRGFISLSDLVKFGKEINPGDRLPGTNIKAEFHSWIIGLDYLKEF